MKYNGKYYYKIMWDCGYAGTDGYEVLEFEEERTERELEDITAQYVEENCQADGWYEEPDIYELEEAWFADSGKEES